MISGHSNLHILHRANTKRSDRDDGDDANQENAEEELHPYEPISPLLPIGLEYERSPSETDMMQLHEAEEEGGEPNKYYASKEFKLSVFFLLLVVSGSANVVGAKMQAVSMYNYGLFLSLFSYVIYVPICFTFIILVSKYGWFSNAIPAEHMELPKRPFAIMGFLDCLAAVMQTFSSIYLPGSLLVLLPQASIPLSMLLSRYALGERYRLPQYIGALTVFVGVLLVLEPVITRRHEPDYLCQAIDLENHCTACSGATTEEACLAMAVMDSHEIWWGDTVSYVHMMPTPLDDSPRLKLELGERFLVEATPTDSVKEGICEWVPLAETSAGRDMSVFIWSFVMVLSCVPMTLSSVYKQIKLRAHGDLHPVFLIGWIGVFQFLFSIVSAPSVGWATGLPLGEIPKNLWDGLKCFLGMGTVDWGCHPDSLCSTGHAFFFVTFCLVCQALYMLATMFVLKYGSTSLLYLALTMMVPLGNLTFSLPFIETDASLYLSDITALLVIVLGLLLYRFGHKLPKRRHRRRRSDAEASLIPQEEVEEDPESEPEPCHPLLEPLISYAYV